MPSKTAKVQASHISYELHSLGWKSFQDLCAAIMGEVLGQTVQIFLPTKDGGRDGAFQGSWKASKQERMSGSFVVQCKFTSKPHVPLALSALDDEAAKAKRLAAHGFADNYILMTNCPVSAATETAVRKRFLGLQGVKTCLVFGR